MKLNKSRDFLWNKLSITSGVVSDIESKTEIAIEALKDVNRAVNALLDDEYFHFTKDEYRKLQKMIYSEITPLLKQLI